MPQLHFYDDPIPLEKKKHAKLKLIREPNFDYAASVNSVPVAGMEFFKCSRHFPILFVKNGESGYIPISILSLRPSGHDYGDKWQEKYIPNYIRRYPFVLSSDGMVLIDSKSKLLSEEEGQDLFQDDGEATEALKEIITYLEQLQFAYKGTEEFTKALIEKDMLEPFSPKIKIGNGNINMGDVYVVDEKKLLELTEQESLEWLKKGWIAWTYAHLHSLDSINLLVKLLAENPEAAQEFRAAAEAQPAANESGAGEVADSGTETS